VRGTRIRLAGGRTARSLRAEDAISRRVVAPRMLLRLSCRRLTSRSVCSFTAFNCSTLILSKPIEPLFQEPIEPTQNPHKAISSIRFDFDRNSQHFNGTHTLTNSSFISIVCSINPAFNFQSFQIFGKYCLFFELLFLNY